MDPCKDALENPLILKKILEKVENSMDLLQLRLVNWMWCDLSSLVLSRRADLSLEFVLHRHNEEYRKRSQRDSEKNHGTVKTLAHLTALLDKSNTSFFSSSSSSSTSSTFPCSSFTFSEGRLDDAEIQRFLQPHGKNIRHLEFTHFLLVSEPRWDQQPNSPFYTVTFDPTLLRNLLFSQTPNLHTLNLDAAQFDLLFGHLPHKVYLPHLKVLGFRCDDTVNVLHRRYYRYPRFEFLKEVIENVAVNLVRIDLVDDQHFDLEFPRWLQNFGRLDLLGNLVVCLQPPNNKILNDRYDQNLEVMTSARPGQWRLTRFRLIYESYEGGQIATNLLISRSVFRSIRKILEASRSSLTEMTLDIVCLDRLHPNIFLPPGGLPNVTKLHLRMPLREKQRMSYEFETTGGRFPFCPPNYFSNIEEVLVNGDLWWMSQKKVDQNDGIIDGESVRSNLRSEAVVGGSDDENSPLLSPIMLTSFSFESLQTRYSTFSRVFTPKLVRIRRRNGSGVTSLGYPSRWRRWTLILWLYMDYLLVPCYCSCLIMGFLFFLIFYLVHLIEPFMPWIW